MNTLNKLKVGDKSIIKDIYDSCELKERLFDIGFTPGTDVKCLYKSPFNDPVAYLIKDTVIALRKKDSNRVVIE